MAPKLYHLVPSPNIRPPPNGPIDVGQLFAKPHDLETHFDRATEYLRPDDEDIYCNTLRDEKITISNARAGKAGIWAKFLDLQAFGGGLGGNFDSSREGDYVFETLKIRFIHPSNEYIYTAINQDSPAMFLENKKVVYMLKSIMIAEGTTFTGRNTKGLEGHGNGGISSNGVAVGGEIGGSARNTVAQSFRADEFVFAYSMLKITCGRSEDGSTIVAKKPQQVEGGFMGANGGGAKKQVFKVQVVEEEAHVANNPALVFLLDDVLC